MTEEQHPIETVQPEIEEREERAPGPEILLTFVIAGFILTLDLVTKLIIENNLEVNESYVPYEAIESFFKITHVSNTGAAFGLFPSGSQVITVIAIIVSLVIIVYNMRLPANHRLFRVALGLQLGGAMGNLMSRVRIGQVTDFLDFGPWPVSNIADISIVLGVILLAYLMLFEQKQESHPEEATDTNEAAETQQRDSSDDSTMLWNE
jgi:signal peptidase II